MSETHRKPIPRSGLLAAATIATTLAGCATTAVGLQTTGATPLGSFQVASIGAPPGTFEPETCLAGDHELFLGVDLVDAATGMVVRLVVDPLDGPALRVYDSDSPFDRSVLFFRDECSQFDLSLGETGTTVNNIVERSIELAVDCENVDGATIRGRATAAACD